MIKKHFLYASFVLAAATSAQACSDYYKPSFLAGFHLGYSHMRGKFNSVFDDGLGAPSPFSASADARQSKALAGIFAGYQYVFENGLTLGADATLNYNGNQQLSKELQHGVGQPFRNTLSRQFSMIPALTVGYVFDRHFHAFLSLGLAVSKFTAEVHNVVGNVVAKSAVTRIGFAPSVTLEYAFSRNFSMVGSVGYEGYKKVTPSFGSAIAPTLPRSSYNGSIKPHFMTAKVGFIFKI